MSIIDQIIKAADTISSPKQMVGMALNALAKKDQSTAAMLAQMIKRGENPVEAISKFSKEGKLNADNLNTLKHMYSLAKKGGLKGFDVPESVWKEAEAAISSAGKKPDSWF